MGTFNGTEGDDRFVFTLPPIMTSTVDARGGSDSLLVQYESASAGSFAAWYEFGSFSATVGFSPFIQLTVLHVEQVDYRGTSNDDLFTLKIGPDTSGLTANMDGGLGQDTLRFLWNDISTGISFVVDGAAITSSFGTFSNFEGFYILAGSGNDTITTGSRDDTIRTGGGVDQISAGSGDDSIDVQSIGGTIDAGAGNDSVSIYDASSGFTGTIDGGTGHDRLYIDFTNTATALSLNSGASSATAFGIIVNFEVFTLFAGSGDDRITTGSADDYLIANGGNDIVAAGDGNNTVRGGDGDDILSAGAGNDSIGGGAGSDTINAGAGADTIIGDGGADTIDGGDGDDTIYGDSDIQPNSYGPDGADLIHGGLGNDNIYAGRGDDTIFAEGGNDIIRGDAGADYIDGGDGDDVISGFGGNDVDDLKIDVLIGGAGNDELRAGYGDSADGGSGLDTLSYDGFGASAGINVDFSQLTSGGSITIGGGTISNIEYISGLSGTNYADTIIAGATSGSGIGLAGWGGDDHLTGTTALDYINGGNGDDVIAGRGGYDHISGGAGSDTILGTAAELNGVILDDIGAGDRILFTDANIATFSFSYGHQSLSFSGGVISIGNVPGRLVASAAPEGGVQIKVEAQPVATADQIAEQLTSNFWNWAGEAPHHFNVTPGGTLTVDIHTLNTAGQALARAALNEWHEITGLQFQEVSADGQITFNDENDPTGAQPRAYTETTSINGYTEHAGVYIPRKWLVLNGSSLTTYSFQTYIHEIGHALGLGHAGDYNFEAEFRTDALFANDSWAMSVMSYFDQDAVDAPQFDRAYAITPMQADIVAIQSLYGLSAVTRLGDTVYGFNSNAGAVYDASTNKSAAFTIFDSGGSDTLDYSGYSGFQVIDLNPESFSWVNGIEGGLSIARGTIIEKAIGGSYTDHIIGNAADNVLDGRGGADWIDGGAGNDRIVYDVADDPANVKGGMGTDTLVVIDQAAPTGYNLIAGGFEGAEVTLHDTANANSWSSVVTNYTTAWQALNQTMVNDDGSRTFTAFDWNNAQAWHQVWFTYNVVGQQISEDYRYDDGGRSWVAIDAAGAQPWQQVWFTYNASGQQVSEDYRYDDGKRSWVAIDAGNVQNWAQVWFTYDTSGHKISEDYRYDDGGRSWVAFDGASVRPWDHIWFTYDAAGHQTSEDRTNDDGTRIWTAYDANLNQAWSQSAYYYDGTGHLYQQVTTWDDGHTSTTLF
jgi:Ca2+-binding RTX toxin-like protein